MIEENDIVEQPKENKSRAEYMRLYYWNNHKKVLSQKRARYRKNSESERERYRKYYREHRAEILARRKDKYITTRT